MVTISNILMKVSALPKVSSMILTTWIVFPLLRETYSQTLDESALTETVGFAIIGVKDAEYGAGSSVTVVLMAKKVGTAVLFLYENSTGEDGYKSNKVATTIT